MLTLKNSKMLFDAGVFNAVSFERTIGGWLVYLSGSTTGFVCDARTKSPRVFKTLDAACSTAVVIGFRVDKVSTV